MVIWIDGSMPLSGWHRPQFPNRYAENLVGDMPRRATGLMSSSCLYLVSPIDLQHVCLLLVGADD